MSKRAAELLPGDTFAYRDGITVSVLRAPEGTRDMFGRDMLKVWCSAEGREGYVILGPDAEMH